MGFECSIGCAKHKETFYSSTFHIVIEFRPTYTFYQTTRLSPATGQELTNFVTWRVEKIAWRITKPEIRGAWQKLLPFAKFNLNFEKFFGFICLLTQPLQAAEQAGFMDLLFMATPM